MVVSMNSKPPALAGAPSLHADEANSANGTLLTPEEIAVLTGRDETHGDDGLDILDDEIDRLPCSFDDPGSLGGGVGFDVMEAGGGDDRVLGNMNLQAFPGTALDGLPLKTDKAERDIGGEPSVGIDIINLSAECEDWVMIADHESDDELTSGLDLDTALPTRVVAQRVRARDRCRSALRRRQARFARHRAK